VLCNFYIIIIIIIIMLTLKLIHSVCWYKRCIAKRSQLLRTSELVGHMQEILGQRYVGYFPSSASVHGMRLAGTVNTTGHLVTHLWASYKCTIHNHKWPRCLRRGSAAAGALGLRVRIASVAWMSLVSVVCCQVEVSALGLSLVQRSRTECGVWVWSWSLDN
jgi:hypothetical protein